MTDLPDLSAVELLTLYRDRRASPVEVMTAVLAGSRRWSPNSTPPGRWIPTRPWTDARASEARWAKGEPIGAARRRAGDGQGADRDQGRGQAPGHGGHDLVPEPADAPPAARLREAGAVIFCKTTSPDFGMLSSGLSSFHKLSRNPVGPVQDSWRLQRRRGRRRGRRLRSAAPGHRHRRLDPPARRLVRRLRVEAQQRARPDRSALYR
jgi:aspartyl-tRNA(Asn)/glutamyl-tRNA(Gln) amidotransferase subunit A